MKPMHRAVTVVATSTERRISCRAAAMFALGVLGACLWFLSTNAVWGRDLQPTTVSVRVVAAEQLPNVPGKTLTVVIVKYGPGAKSAPHRHSGFVLAYVLEGKVRSQVSGGPVKVYSAGEHFIEHPGSRHLVSANASTTEPAKLMAIFVADDGAKLTRPLQ